MSKYPLMKGETGNVCRVFLRYSTRCPSQGEFRVLSNKYYFAGSAWPDDPHYYLDGEN